MNDIEAKALLTQRLDIYRKQFLGGLLALLAAVVIFLAGLVLDYSVVSTLWATILMLAALLVFFLGIHMLLNTLSPRLTLRRCLNRLEKEDLLKEAAAALNAPEEGLLGDLCFLSGGYLFSPEGGAVLPVREVGWVYFHHMGNRDLDLVVETNTWGSRVSLLKITDKTRNEERDALLKQAEALFPHALIGYSKENQAAWKALCAQRREGK